MIRTATKDGICKVNIDTDLRLAMTAEIRKHFVEHPADFDPRKYLGPARDAIKRMVQRAREENRIVDATQGRKTKSVIVCEDARLVLSALQPDTIMKRCNEKPDRGDK